MARPFLSPFGTNAKARSRVPLKEICGLENLPWQGCGEDRTGIFGAVFSEAFLILRARDVGLPIMLVPAVLVVMNVVYAVAAYPAGVMSDRVNRLTVLAIGIVLLVAADIALALLPSIAGAAFGVVLWGLHMGLTQGLLAALVADTSPAELRGTAYGFFNLLGGLAMLAASVIAGALWDAAGPQGTFFAGAGFALAALAGFSAVHGKVNEVAGGSHNKVSPNDA